MEALLAKPHATFSNRGKRKFIHQGRMYTKHRDLKGVNEGKVSAECDQKSIGCKGRAWFSEEGYFMKMVTGHGCESNPSHIAVTAIRNEEKHLAMTTTMQTGQILAQVRNQARTSGIHDAMPQAKARKKVIRRARTDSEDCKPPPPVPTSLESIIIPQSYRLYDAINGREPDEWLLADSCADKAAGGRIFIFGRKSYSQWMAMVEKIFVDGTFKIAPPLFEQVFVVLAKRNDYVFPIANALLPNKRTVTYQIFFKMLHEVFPQLNPQGISCDYELAIQNAARGEWEEVSIDGCYWHLCPNMYKHLGQKINGCLKCRKIVALSCVPISRLDECFSSLKKHLPVSLSPILNWFEKYYLGSMQFNGIRKTARFPIDSWNLVERIQNGENRTNNYAEAYHRKVACELGVCHPSFFKFIDSMKLVQRGVDEAYSEMVVGHDPPIKPKKYRTADERMLALVKKAVKSWEKVVPIEYLSGIAYNFRMAQGPYLISTTQQEVLLIADEIEPERERNDSPEEQLAVEHEPLIISRFGINLTKEDMSRLRPGHWFNDNLVNFYLELIRHRSMTDCNLPKVIIFSTQFYQKLLKNGVDSVKEWGKNLDIFGSDVVLIPLDLVEHWALVVVRMSQRRLLYYDSLHGHGSDHLIKIKEYLQIEALTKSRLELDPISWLGLSDKSVPKQTNGCDCGVFICQFAESASREVRPSCKQENMDEYRKQMASELQAGELLKKIET